MYKTCNRCGRIVDFDKGCSCKKWHKKRASKQDTFRNSRKWQLKRKEILVNANYLCELCFSKNKLVYDNLSVHHITPLEADIGLALENNNLIVLCSRCHSLAEKGKISKNELLLLAKKRETKSPY